MIEGIIFDMDGVLVSLNLDMKEMTRKVEECLGFKVDRTVFGTLVRLIEKDKELYERCLSAIDEVEMAAIERTMTVFPDTRMVIEQLSKSYPLALVTLQGRRAALKVLDKLNIRQLFRFIFTREDSLFRSEQIRKAIQALGINKENVLMVGDRKSDKLAAEEVGCKVIIVRRENYKPLEGTITIHSLHELLTVIKGF
nr:HAD family hydrolase [Candidatus Freyrarchaeum guaymaensis]